MEWDRTDSASQAIRKMEIWAVGSNVTVGRINRSGTRTVVRIRTHYELIVTVTSLFCYAPV